MATLDECLGASIDLSTPFSLNEMPPVTNNRDELLRAVCENPGDDAPRLQYAEFLATTGDPDDALRGEFIRIQCELAQPDLADDRWRELDPRHDVLEKNGERWAEQLPKLEGVSWNPFEYRRGFVWGVWCRDAESFRRHAAVIFAAAPIQSISFLALQSVTPVVTTPELSRVRRLILEGFRLRPADALALAVSPHLANLTALHLSDNNLGDAGAASLAASSHLRRLENLDLGYNGIGDEGVCALTASPIVTSLEHLGLAGNGLTDAGARALASSPHLRRITGLTLWDCTEIGSPGKKELEVRFGDAVSFSD